MARNGEIKDQENFVFITFQQIYKGPTFMGNPQLKIDTSTIKDLFDNESYKFFLEKHVAFFSQKFQSYLSNLIDGDCRTWHDSKMPEQENGFYEGKLPVDLNQLVNEQFQLVADANDIRFSKAQIRLVFDGLNFFVDKIRDRLLEYRANHWKDPKILAAFYEIKLVSQFEVIF